MFWTKSPRPALDPDSLDSYTPSPKPKGKRKSGIFNGATYKPVETETLKRRPRAGSDAVPFGKRILRPAGAPTRHGRFASMPTIDSLPNPYSTPSAPKEPEYDLPTLVKPCPRAALRYLESMDLDVHMYMDVDDLLASHERDSMEFDGRRELRNKMLSIGQDLPVFGASLRELSIYASTIVRHGGQDHELPILVFKCVEALAILKVEKIDMRGLHEAAVVRLADLRRVFDSPASKFGHETDLTDASIPIVLNLLLQFIEALPSPIVPIPILECLWHWCLKPSIEADEEQEAWEELQRDEHGLLKHPVQYLEELKIRRKAREELEKRLVLIARKLILLMPLPNLSLLLYLLAYFAQAGVLPHESFHLRQRLGMHSKPVNLHKPVTDVELVNLFGVGIFGVGEEEVDVKDDLTMGAGVTGRASRTMLWFIRRWGVVLQSLFEEGADDQSVVEQLFKDWTGFPWNAEARPVDEDAYLFKTPQASDSKSFTLPVEEKPVQPKLSFGSLPADGLFEMDKLSVKCSTKDSDSIYSAHSTYSHQTEVFHSPSLVQTVTLLQQGFLFNRSQTQDDASVYSFIDDSDPSSGSSSAGYGTLCSSDRSSSTTSSNSEEELETYRLLLIAHARIRELEVELEKSDLAVVEAIGESVRARVRWEEASLCSCRSSILDNVRSGFVRDDDSEELDDGVPEFQGEGGFVMAVCMYG